MTAHTFQLLKKGLIQPCHFRLQALHAGTKACNLLPEVPILRSHSCHFIFHSVVLVQSIVSKR